MPSAIAAIVLAAKFGLLWSLQSERPFVNNVKEISLIRAPRAPAVPPPAAGAKSHKNKNKNKLPEEEAEKKKKQKKKLPDFEDQLDHLEEIVANETANDKQKLPHSDNPLEEDANEAWQQDADLIKHVLSENVDATAKDTGKGKGNGAKGRAKAKAAKEAAASAPSKGDVASDEARGKAKGKAKGKGKKQPADEAGKSSEVATNQTQVSSDKTEQAESVEQPPADEKKEETAAEETAGEKTAKGDSAAEVEKNDASAEEPQDNKQPATGAEIKEMNATAASNSAGDEAASNASSTSSETEHQNSSKKSQHAMKVKAPVTEPRLPWVLNQSAYFCRGAKLLPSVVSLKECEANAENDAECGRTLVSNGDYCACVRKNHVCSMAKSTMGNMVFKVDFSQKNKHSGAFAPASWLAALLSCLVTIAFGVDV